MKDKSRFLSSVIVSLLAGFIYYLFGLNISDNVERSVKAVLSSNDTEEYMTQDFMPLNPEVCSSVAGSFKNNIKVVSKKKRSFKFMENSIFPDIKSISDNANSSQAKFQKPSPDRNIDFTAELEKLISRKNRVTPLIKPGREFKVDKSMSNSEEEIAEMKSGLNNSEKVRKNFERSQIKYYRKNYKGNGFEYNVIINDKSSNSGRNTIKYDYNASEKKKVKSECREFNNNSDPKINTEVRNQYKIKIISPKVRIKAKCDNDEDSDSDDKTIEINVPDNSDNEDSM